MEPSEISRSTIQDVLRVSRQRALVLTGQIERNQGRPTFTGRLTLDQFAELTVAHNRRWAEEAGQSMNDVTREK
jgi:hypothetical protein